MDKFSEVNRNILQKFKINDNVEIYSDDKLKAEFGTVTGYFYNSFNEIILEIETIDNFGDEYQALNQSRYHIHPSRVKKI